MIVERGGEKGPGTSWGIQDRRGLGSVAVYTAVSPATDWKLDPFSVIFLLILIFSKSRNKNRQKD